MDIRTSTSPRSEKQRERDRDRPRIPPPAGRLQGLVRGGRCERPPRAAPWSVVHRDVGVAYQERARGRGRGRAPRLRGAGWRPEPETTGQLHSALYAAAAAAQQACQGVSIVQEYKLSYKARRALRGAAMDGGRWGGCPGVSLYLQVCTSTRSSTLRRAGVWVWVCLFVWNEAAGGCCRNKSRSFPPRRPRHSAKRW